MRLNGFVKDVGVVFSAGIIAGLFNLLYQFVMVRMLTPVDFGVLNALLSVTLLSSVAAGPLQTLVTKFVATFKARGSFEQIGMFLKLFFKKVAFAGLLAAVLVFIYRREIAGFLKVENDFLIVLAGILLMLSTILPLNLGGLQGLQKFKTLGIASILNSVLRFVFGIVLVRMGFQVGGALGAVALASFIALVFSFVPLKAFFFGAAKGGGCASAGEKLELWPIYKYVFPAFVALVSFGLLTNVDVILVKRFFSPLEAGYYSMAQMVGKIILFLPGAVTIVMFPKVSEHYARNEDTRRILFKCLLAVGAVSFSAGAFCIMFPKFVLRVLSGTVYAECVPLVMPFAVSMSFFALAHVFLFYHLSVHNMKLIFTFLIFAGIQSVLIVLFRGSLLQVLYVLSACSILLFFVNTLGVALKPVKT